MLKICPKCGKENVARLGFCVKCGADLYHDADGSEESAADSRADRRALVEEARRRRRARKLRSAGITVAIVVILACAGVAAFLFLRDDGGQSAVTASEAFITTSTMVASTTTTTTEITTTTTEPESSTTTVPDTTPPSVAFVSPREGGEYKVGEAFKVTPDVSDEGGVARVEFQVNHGDEVFFEGTAGATPWVIAWSTKGMKAQKYRLTLTAYDLAGNSAKTEIRITLTTK
jgi:hypothetical protein